MGGLRAIELLMSMREPVEDRGVLRGVSDDDNDDDCDAEFRR